MLRYCAIRNRVQDPQETTRLGNITKNRGPHFTTTVSLLWLWPYQQCISTPKKLFFAVSSYHGEKLKLRRVQRHQMGAYLCIASNSVPPSVSKRIRLNVNCEY